LRDVTRHQPHSSTLATALFMSETRLFRNSTSDMASHVPFLAVRPDDQFSSKIKKCDFSTRKGISSSAMDAPEAPYLPHAPAIPVARLPAAVRFFLVCVLSLTFSTLCYSLASEYAGYELAAVSRTITDDRHVSALLGWKFLELSFAWYAGHKCTYISCITILTYLTDNYDREGSRCAHVPEQRAILLFATHLLRY